MPEPTYDVYRPTRNPVPEPPVGESRPATYERPHHQVSCSPRLGIPDPFVPGAICVVIWAITGFGYFWPMWVLLPGVLMLIGGGRRRH